MSLFTKIFGDPNAKVVKDILPIVEKINSLESELLKLSDVDLKAKTNEFKTRLTKGEALDDLLPEAFAVVRETSKRVTGMRHFDVQLIGGTVLHRGSIAEMRTGEGKTLVATLPLYLNALAGQGAHLVTVNDYLAKRDAVWMGQIFDALGMTIGVIQQQNVSYKYNSKSPVILSETKNLLLDGQRSFAMLPPEAGKQDDNSTPQDDNVDLSQGSATDKERDVKGAYKVEYEYLEPCSRRDAYACDITYGTNNEFGFDYLRDNMAGSLNETVQRPLNFAIVDEVDSILIDEARTPLIISAPAEEAQDLYYQFADIVAGMVENEDYNVDEKMRSSTFTESGLKKVEKALGVENIYAQVSTNLVHHAEQSLRARALFRRDRDYVVENGEVMIVDEFTGRKMPGRRYSEGLHQAIEAKERVAIQRESRTMATITFQNYFRLYHKLGGMTGTAVTEAEEFGKIYNLEVVVVPTNKGAQRIDHSDRIYRTEEAKYKSIATEVKKLQARGQPVLIGTISVEKNEGLSIFLEREGVKHEILNAKNHEREGEIIAQAGRAGAVTLATNMAGRGVDIILGGNPFNPELAEAVKTAGGLFVVGTERHESRRIDNQLRGRAGRQGDPGETQFYLSTDDDLMRIFAGERIKNVMKTLRVPDDMPIDSGTLSRLIESAQKKVEGFHFDSRKHLLEYDDVLNRHRTIIYEKRRQILEQYESEKGLNVGNVVNVGSNSNKRSDPTISTSEAIEQSKPLRAIIFDYIENELESIVAFHTNVNPGGDWNIQEIAESAATIFNLTESERAHILSLDQARDGKRDEVMERTVLIDYLIELARAKYDNFISTVNDPALVLETEKQILLSSMDNLWVDHLVAVDYLRTGIGLRGYGQRDPLVEYKKECYHMFNDLLTNIQKEVVYSIYKVGLGIQSASSAPKNKKLIFQGPSDSLGQSLNDTLNFATKSGGPVIHTTAATGPGKSEVKVGRNDACPCGSGKKYKNCHGK